MKPIVEKVLKSGMVDRHLAELMEKWKIIPEGASGMVHEGALKDATKEQLEKLAAELGDEVAKEHILRETMLDLDKLKWPCEVGVHKDMTNDSKRVVAERVLAVIDRMGRYFFRIQDVKEDWFVPGYYLWREGKYEQILQSEVLYHGEIKICVQVSTAHV